MASKPQKPQQKPQQALRKAPLKDAVRSSEMFETPERGQQRLSFEEQVAAFVAEKQQMGGGNAVYQRLAVSADCFSTTTTADTSTTSTESSSTGKKKRKKKKKNGSAQTLQPAASGIVEQRLMEVMAASNHDLDKAALKQIIDTKVKDKRLQLFMPKDTQRQRLLKKKIRAERLPRARRLRAAKSAKTVQRATAELEAAADTLERMAEDGKQLAGLGVTVRVCRRQPHLVGRQFVVLGAYKNRESVLLLDKQRRQTVKVKVDDVQACVVHRLGAVVPLRLLVQHTIC